jgi:hypothetical protein
LPFQSSNNSPTDRKKELHQRNLSNFACWIWSFKRVFLRFSNKFGYLSLNLISGQKLKEETIKYLISNNIFNSCFWFIIMNFITPKKPYGQNV